VLVLMVILPAYWWAFLGLGALTEAFIAFRTLQNPAINAKAVAHIFEREFKPKALKAADLQQKTTKAVEYLQQVETAVLQTKAGPMRDRLKRTTDEMVDWVEGIFNLAARLDTYNQDTLIKQDLNAVPKAIQDLRRRLIETDDPQVKQQIQRTIEDREDQYASLKRLAGTMEQADLLLERNLSDMGRVYSQVLLMSSLKETSGHGENLQEEISEHVNQLEDLVEAMDEFHARPGDRRYSQLEQTSF